MFGNASLTKRAVVTAGATGVVTVLARQFLGQWALPVVLPVGAVFIAAGLRTDETEQQRQPVDRESQESEAQ